MPYNVEVARHLAFVSLLLGVCAGSLWLENRAIRADLAEVQGAYSHFLNLKSQGVAIKDRLRPNSLAVFRHPNGDPIACAIIAFPQASASAASRPSLPGK